MAAREEICIAINTPGRRRMSEGCHEGGEDGGEDGGSSGELSAMRGDCEMARGSDKGEEKQGGVRGE